MEFYVVDGGERVGPFSIEQLKQRGLAADSLVWREGLSDWVRASQLPELNSLLASSPPDYPQPASSPHVFGPSPVAAAWEAAPRQRHSKLGIASFIVGLLAAVAYVAMVVAVGVAIGDDLEAVDADEPVVVMAGCTFILGMLANIVGMILGAVGVAQQNRRGLWAYLGLGLNSLLLLTCCVFGVIGSMNA